MNKCSACGYSGIAPLHKHHVNGRKKSSEVIYLCPTCHAETHQAILIIDNQASRLAMKEIELLEQKRFVSHKERQAILSRHGYTPFFDGEEEWINQQ